MKDCRASVAQPDCLGVAEDSDHPGCLPPAAEMDHIAEIAAAPGTQRGLAVGARAEMLDELGRVRESVPAGKD